VGSFATAATVIYLSRQLRLATFVREQDTLRQAERKRNDAEDMWRQHEPLCIQYPEFSYPDLLEVSTEHQTFNGSNFKFLSYEYFVSMTLYAAEEILKAYPNQPDWLESVLDELDFHRKFLVSDYFFKEYLKTTAPVLQNLIRNMRERPGDRRHPPPPR
jgi:hypothetical protein